MAKGIKTKKKKPPVETEGSGFDFYVIVQAGSDPVAYVSLIRDGQPVFDTDFDNAIWSNKENKVDTFITQNQLTNVSKEGKNGDHPAHRPPL